MRGGKLLALALLGCATSALAQDPDLPAGAGPRGTSGEVRDDAVGYAALASAGQAQVAVLHPHLPTGSFVEVTALDSGRTIAALVAGPYAGAAAVALSPMAAQALGVDDGAAVRVRAVTPTPQEQAALRAGQAAGARLDAPPTLLTALRRKLPVRETARRPSAAPASPPLPAPRTTSEPRGAYGVQVATLSAADRAAALARTLAGHVVAADGLYRVQLGPFPDAATATRARAAAARAGYGDARVFRY